MPKIAFLFPGQGSQELGMGRDLLKSDDYYRSLLDHASKLTGESLEELSQKGPEKKFIKAFYLQPMITCLSLAYLRHVREAGIVPDVVAGHSLGEITTLAAAGVVDDMICVEIATERGRLMDENAAKCNGTMMAVLFAPLEDVERVLAELNIPDRIALANDNAPSQVVLSGDDEALTSFQQKFEGEKLGKCKKILVSGPWHSHFIQPAKLAFEEWAEHIVFKKPHTPFVLNATAKAEHHPSTIKHLVTWQLTSPVFWRESMDTLRDMGIDTILEIGPGRVLSGLVRVNGFPRSTPVYNINNLRGVETAVEELKKQKENSNTDTNTNANPEGAIAP